MASPLSKKKNLQARWKQLVKKISSDQPINLTETEQDKEARKARARADYGFFVTYYFPHYAKDKAGNVTECAPFHIKEANEVLKNPMFKGIWEWFRGSAKSTNADIFLPMWLKIQEPRQLNVMMLIGKNNKTATRLLQDIQGELAANPRFLNDFGQQIKDGSWEQGEFQTNDGCAFVALGMGEPPRGTRFGSHRPDFIVCDDLDDDKMKKNPSRIREAVEWLERAVLGTGDTGIGRFLFVNNRIAKNGILATLVAIKPHWHHSKVNALQEDGTPNWKRYTREFYAALLKDVGWKAFQTEWQNDPQEDAGVFEHEQIKWEKIPSWEKLDSIVMYGDMSYSTSKKSDFTSIPAWAKWGNRLVKLKVYHRQGQTLRKAIEWWFEFYISLPAPIKSKFRCYVEANATQKLLLKTEIDLACKKYGIVNFIKYDTDRKGDKNDRIGSMTSAYENGDTVVYNIDEKEDPDMIASIEQLTGWEEGAAHDDGPDADQSAWQKLQKLGRLSGRTGQRSGKFQKNTSRGF
ncbi:hypothetical protein GCM10023185_15440 [Hymenobacter saemangeumensis]|uniref:Terminase n=1 Tax=Hymenobacter saemangeumensis TaxID=1084522 RepID=A0ABP8I999_9BACT